ncbi:MAG: 23S rRNA (adenine(2503)-C(2))-methyltransferase RlmN [Phycisphaerae bacterium]|nr:23S rRNA (adenine(2503)-C(2))-methyltransferase RlmN [Phycisphaerae bacterium]
MLDLDQFSLIERLTEAGLERFRVDQILGWVYRRRARSFDEMTNLSKTLRLQLAERFDLYTSEIERRQTSTDGTFKLLLRWPDGATSECVMIPQDTRRAVCVSTQVGCPVGCAFCASGLDGLERSLTSGEIVEQAMQTYLQLPEDQPLTHVVFMGIGEPLANYDATVSAVRTLNADWGLNIGARRITISTVGLPRQIRRLAEEGLQVGLAISLHAPNDELRREIIPWAERTSIDDLVEAGRHYFDRTGREVTLEYVLLGELNDRPAHAKQLAAVARGMRCNVNLIRYNGVSDLPYRRPGSEATHAFLEVLRKAGVNAHIRASRGMDIEAACGQLRRQRGDL